MRDRLVQICSEENVLFDENVGKYTTFKVGGTAKAVILPENTTQLKEVIKLLKNNYIILGNGSNVLFKDNGTDEYVIITKKLKKIEIQDDMVYAQCGALMPALSIAVAEQSLAGLEFASGIPGTVGGGIYMNAGAYDGVLCEIIEYADCIDENGEEHRIYKKDLDMYYRHSVFMENNMIITGGCFKLKKGNKSDIYALMQEYNNRRREKQPLEYKSAGSTFKRPEGYFAGKLVEDAGLKGFHVGDAYVSEKHAGFIVNKGNATAKEILAVIDKCKQDVMEKFGVSLEPEIKIFGKD